MRKTFAAAALAASFSLLSLPAQSADNGIYLGASVGQSGVQYDEEFDGENFSFDASATGFKAIAGWRFIDWLAVEANYVDLGSGDDNVLGTRVESDVNGVSLSAVGFVPVGPVDLFARVGAVNWNAAGVSCAAPMPRRLPRDHRAGCRWPPHTRLPGRR